MIVRATVPINWTATVGWVEKFPLPGAPTNVPVKVNGATMVAEAPIGGSVNGALSKSTLARLTEFRPPTLVKVSPPNVTTPGRSFPIHLPKNWVSVPGLRQHFGPVTSDEREAVRAKENKRPGARTAIRI